MLNVLFIVDSYNWALSNRAENLKIYYSKHKILIRQFNDLDGLDFNDFDLVYVLNWKDHIHIFKKISANRKYRLVTTISSHTGRGDALSISNILNNYDAISTSSIFLFDEFKNSYPGKVFYTPFGVNTEVFYKKNNPSDFFNIFGWVGNHKRPVKRFEIIKDVFKSLGREYCLKTAFQTDGFNKSEMLKFYNSIGTLICFSESEGTPNPILEAGACGRAIISTNVGNVPQLNKDFCIRIVSNEKDLEKEIVYLKNNPKKISLYGNNINKIISNEWSWKNQANRFEDFLGIKK